MLGAKISSIKGSLLADLCILKGLNKTSLIKLGQEVYLHTCNGGGTFIKNDSMSTKHDRRNTDCKEGRCRLLTDAKVPVIKLDPLAIQARQELAENQLRDMEAEKAEIAREKVVRKAKKMKN